MPLHNVRINKPAVLHYFDTAGVVVNPALLTGNIYNEDGSLIVSLGVTSVVLVPGLYTLDAVTLTRVGGYPLVWVYNGVKLSTDYVHAGADPTPAFRLGLPQTARLIAAEGDDFYLMVLGSDGSEYLAQTWAAYNATTLSYTASVTFTKEDDYLLVWYRDVGGGVLEPHEVERAMVSRPVGLEHVVITACDLDPQNGGTPYIGARVAVSLENGTYITSGITDDEGRAHFDLTPDSYVVSLVKSDLVFDRNNFRLEVVDTTTSTLNNVLTLFTESFPVVASSWDTPVAKCTLFGRFINMDGSPLAMALVQVAIATPPTLLTGNTVFGRYLDFVTDYNGYVSFQLVQGIKVDISVTPLGVRRRITVPSVEGPVDFMTLVSGAKDQFDILTPTLPAAARRSL